MAVQGSRQFCLLAAILLLAKVFEAQDVSYPFLWAFAATLLLFSLLIDQLAARSLALVNPDRAFHLSLPAVRVFSAPLIPLIEPLRLLLEFLRKMLGRSSESSLRGEGDIDQSTAEDVETERLRVAQGEMIENVVEFSGTVVREVMTPRTDMVTMEEDASLADLVALVIRENHSRIPITRGSIDQVVGMVHARDLLGLSPATDLDRSFRDVVRPILSVPETKLAMELLREMQAQGLQMAIVVDEYGGTAGLITIEDLLEEVVGEIADEHEARRPELLGQQDGSYVVRGSYPIFDLAERLGVTIPDVEADSVGGVIVAILGRLPETGETVEVGALRLEVADADSRRVRRVRVHRLGQEARDEPEEGGA
jgi:putative hemolysin